ncbi:MAG TPA: hypothetical protein VM938_10145 [Acidimicrobiales bacterium]|nr:hypothetical protein [Acidimicrobiales bacterium]
MSDQATADAFLRRQLVLTWLAGGVVLLVLAGAALALFLAPPVDAAFPEELRGRYRGFVAVAVAGAVALVVLLAVLVRHAVRLAGFTFRKEVHE